MSCVTLSLTRWQRFDLHQQEMMQSVVSHTLVNAPLPPQVLGVFGGFVTAARVMAGVVTLGACALLAWMIRRLMSAGVRQEFA